MYSNAPPIHTLATIVAQTSTWIIYSRKRLVYTIVIYYGYPFQEKSKLDWNLFKKSEGIEEELAQHNKDG